MKIVFISGMYPPHTKGGGEISTYLIAEGLKARRHEVHIITGRDIPELLEKPLFERRQSKKIAKRLNELLWTNGSNTSPRSPLPRKERGPQAVVHAHDFRSALALSELNLPNAVATVRDYAPVCGTTHNILADGSRCHCTWHDVLRTKRFQEVGFPRNYARAWQYWYNTPYRKEAFRKLKHQIFISHAQQHEIEEQLDLSGITKAVIYNPVPSDYAQGKPTQEERLGNVLYVGRLEDYKGVMLLLSAWKEVAGSHAETQLTLIGEGAQRNEYETWVKQQGLQNQVTFAGRVQYKKLRERYDAAHIVVAPHIWTEPFGRTIVEAMARGKIVVAANTGGPAEIIQNGKTGILFERNSKEALAKVLGDTLRMNSDDCREMDMAAREWVAANLTAQKIAEQYEMFYAKIRERT